MSYRDYLEAQKKYIRTKKEALDAKKERKQRPRPSKVDPPPPSNSPWLITLTVVLFLIPIIISIFILPDSLAPAQLSNEELKIWVYCSDQEFLDLKNWLEPELLTNELIWTIAQATNKYEMMAALHAGDGDLLIIEKDFAYELYDFESLAPLTNKHEGSTWENCFSPLWEAQPFRKTYGWAIPMTGNISDARHLFTVMRQFAPTFSSWKQIQQ